MHVLLVTSSIRTRYKGIKNVHLLARHCSFYVEKGADTEMAEKTYHQIQSSYLSLSV